MLFGLTIFVRLAYSRNVLHFLSQFFVLFAHLSHCGTCETLAHPVLLLILDSVFLSAESWHMFNSTINLFLGFSFFVLFYLLCLSYSLLKLFSTGAIPPGVSFASIKVCVCLFACLCVCVCVCVCVVSILFVYVFCLYLCSYRCLMIGIKTWRKIFVLFFLSLPSCHSCLLFINYLALSVTLSSPAPTVGGTRLYHCSTRQMDRYVQDV
jgi:hypothetical protein